MNDGNTGRETARTGIPAAYARTRHLQTEQGPGSGAARIGAGLTAVVSVKVDRPEFHGSTRGELSGAAVRARVEAAVRERLGTWLEAHPEQADAILRRIVCRAD
jgi:DNA gyrase subunit B